MFFTTIDVPESQRLNQWIDTVCDTVLHLDCMSTSPAPFFGEIKTRQIKEICFTHVRTQEICYERTLAGIRNGKERMLVINFQLSGNSSITQDGRTADLEAGDFACFDTSRPYHVNASNLNEVVTINVPCEMILSNLGLTEQVTALTIRGNTRIGAIASHFLRDVVFSIDSVRQSTAERLATTSLGLIITAFGELLEQQPASRRSSRMLLLYRAKTLIDHDLGDPLLDADRIARGVGISKRYLAELFHAEDTSVRKWIWHRRLEKSRLALSDRLLSGKSISLIAFDCGFNDMSHFCHRFRDAYSATPTEYRRQQPWSMLS